MDVFIKIHHTTDGFCSYTLQLQWLCDYCLALGKLFVFCVSRTDGFNTKICWCSDIYIDQYQKLRICYELANFQLHCAWTIIFCTVTQHFTLYNPTCQQYSFSIYEVNSSHAENSNTTSVSQSKTQAWTRSLYCSEWTNLNDRIWRDPEVWDNHRCHQPNKFWWLW